MIRVAAVGDVHYDTRSREKLRALFGLLDQNADLFLIAGDLTQSGAINEAKALIEDLSVIRIPVVTVLGNHDFHQNNQDIILRMLRESGVIALESESTVLKIGSKSVGIMGMKGFGGGFFGACVTEFGETEMKSFARHSRQQADVLRQGLAEISADFKFALLHFSPVEGTLRGEKKEIYPFLGSYLLAEAIDSVGIHCCFHGHAHFGVEKSSTNGGIPVRNVALPVIKSAYKIYSFEQP